MGGSAFAGSWGGGEVGWIVRGVGWDEFFLISFFFCWFEMDFVGGEWCCRSGWSLSIYIY